MLRRRSSLAVVLAWLALGSSASADPILAGPASPSFDVMLDARTKGYQRQQDVFCAVENGISLDAIFNPGDVQSVKDFFAQSAVTDYQQFSGKHPFAALASFDEYEDEGNFGGIASVGVAARLIVLRAEQAPAAEIDAARAAAVRAARAWHVYGSIGGPGVVARGVRRITPWNMGDPPFPGAAPQLTPLKDMNGKPLPADKANTWRAPVAAYPDWIWYDDTSKDQVSGYALGAAWLWDALRDDPMVPKAVTDDLAADLTAFAKALMTVAPELDIDLCIRDADGRLTSFHDLNPRQVTPDAVLPEESPLRNGFNAALALGVIRAAYHVGGDPEVGKYYYEELVGKRDLPLQAAGNAGVIYVGPSTNYSNVNMLAIALATLGRFETDPYVRKELGVMLETQFWSAGSDRDASHVKQAWYDAIYGAYAAKPPAEIRSRVEANLGGFQGAPAFERDRVNCDAGEIAALKCVAVDGTTMLDLDTMQGHNGAELAKDVVPMSVRPDTNFEWRIDPRSVNGAGNPVKMDPGGDYLAAYWLARASDLDDTTKNLSPKARPPLPYSHGAGGAGGGGAGAGGQSASSSSASSSGGPMSSPSSSGCSCELGEGGKGRVEAALALSVIALVLRRRQMRGP